MGKSVEAMRPPSNVWQSHQGPRSWRVEGSLGPGGEVRRTGTQLSQPLGT